MGRNKSLLPYRGTSLIQYIADQLAPRFMEVVVSTNSPETFAFLKLPLIPDRSPGLGPLMGMATCLEASSHTWNLVVATDIPELPLGALPAMFALTETHRCVVPRTPDGRYQPLFGLYHRSVAAEMGSMLEQGERRMMVLMAHCAPATVPLPAEALRNINTPEEFLSLGECPGPDAFPAGNDTNI